MVPETVTNARYTEGGEGGQWLLVDLDDQAVGIYAEQKHLSLYGVVTLLAPPDEPDSFHYLSYQHILGPEPQDGIDQPVLIEAATADPRVVGLTRQFWHDIETDQWRPGKKIT